MTSINQSLFLWLNASAHPPPALLWIARVLADEVVWLLPPIFVLIWLRAGTTWRRALLDATLTAALALGVGALIGAMWPEPRPFALGLGHRYIEHAADASFPSDHLTLIWAIAAAWFLAPALRTASRILFAAGVAVAWARIYVGVHFPLDMLGALTVAWLAALAIHRVQVLLDPLHASLERLRVRAFGPAISSGLVSR